MYQINILNTYNWEWEQLTFNDKPMVFSNKSTLYKALKDNLGERTQVLYNNWFLTSLDGSVHQLGWFMDNHDRLMYKLQLTEHTQDVFNNKTNIEKDKQVLKIIKEELQKDKVLEQYYEFVEPKKVKER